MYKIKYQDQNKILVDLSNNGFLEEKYISNRLPVGDKFFLEVINNQGKSTIIPCNVVVKVNKNLEEIENFLDYISDISQKIFRAAH